MKRYSHAARYTLISQVGLYGFLLLCLVLMPHFLFEKNEGGFSNYGVYMRTILPFSLAFLIGGLYLHFAARALPSSTSRRAMLAGILDTTCLLLLLVLLTTYPYQINAAFDDLHNAAAVLLFVTELIAGTWLSLQLVRDRVNFALLGVEAAGFTLSALTFGGLLHILFLAQIITGIGYGLVLVRSVSRVTASAVWKAGTPGKPPILK